MRGLCAVGVASALLVCAPAWAEIGKTGVPTKVIPIKQMQENKRLRDQIEKVLDRREAARAKAAAAAARKAEEEAAAAEEEETEDAKGQIIDQSVPEGAAERGTTVASKAEPIGPAPSLVIQFNKRRVFFDRELRHMLEASERGKRAVHYSIISEIPAATGNGHRNGRLTDTYEENIDKVMQRFAEMGVQPSRISVTSRPSETATAQTVRIYQE
ncbi:MAG: hypothetical protein K2Q01_10585 [Rickettsiales bacterium]|nr:hypothetical protein [Rickettsiales bacterium]